MENALHVAVGTSEEVLLPSATLRPSALDQKVPVSKAESPPCPASWGEMHFPPLPGTMARAAHGRTFQDVWAGCGGVCVPVERAQGP